MVKFLETFWKTLELRPTSPKSQNPGQKLILKGKGENDLVIEGKTTSIPDLMSRPDKVRPGAHSGMQLVLNKCLLEWLLFSY